MWWDLKIGKFQNMGQTDTLFFVIHNNNGGLKKKCIFIQNYNNIGYFLTNIYYNNNNNNNNITRTKILNIKGVNFDNKNKGSSSLIVKIVLNYLNLSLNL